MQLALSAVAFSASSGGKHCGNLVEYVFRLCLDSCVVCDRAGNVDFRPSNGIKLVTLMLAVRLMGPANRRHLWKEAAMGVFNKRAR